MSLQLRIEKFADFKKEMEAKIIDEAKTIQEEYNAYINNKDIDLNERFNLWLKAPNEMKNNGDYYDFKHPYINSFVYYMTRLAESGTEFDFPVNLTEEMKYLEDVIYDEGEERIEKINQIKQFILDTNLGKTYQQETW